MAGARAVPRVVVVTCMDARIDPHAALGLGRAEAHVLRNAGALMTDDVLRSIVLSQHMFDTRSVWVLAHTDCGLSNIDPGFGADLEAATGMKPPFSFELITDLDGHVREQTERVRSCVWLRHFDDVRGYILDVADGAVRRVE